jgi:hypothetical protein
MMMWQRGETKLRQKLLTRHNSPPPQEVGVGTVPFFILTMLRQPGSQYLSS